VLGVPGLFSAAYGNVGSSIYYALGVAALFALGLTPIAFIVAGLIFGCTALTYAEGTTAMPEAGGSAMFARRGFNELFSFVAGWAQVLNFVVTIAISAFAVPNYLAVFVPILKTWPTNAIFGVGVVGFLAAVNVIGVRESSGVNIGLAVLDLLTQAFLVVLGLFLLLNIDTLIDNVHWGVAPTWDKLVIGIAISMIAYTGIETVSNLAEETRNPAKNVPRSMFGVFGVVILMYALLPLVALSAMPVEEVAPGEFETELAEEFISDPVLGIVEQFPGEALQAVLSVWVGILAATILIIAANAGMLGLSRLVYSMGRHRQLPPVFSEIDVKRRTPANAIVIFAVVAAVLIIPGKLDVLANVYAFGAMLSFAFAHLSIIAMRVREPEMARPFRIPFNLRVAGRQIPLTAIIGAVGTLITWVVVVITQEAGRAVGFPWLLAGLVIYLLYRWVIRESPTKTVKLEPPY
jgi:APA family basic amino acid/polyamine antiporter